MSEAATIIVASADQLENIMPVMLRAFDPAYGEAWSIAQCRGIMALPGSFLVVAEHRDQMIGFALCRSVLDEAELLLFAVDPDFQRHGIGRAILAGVFTECQLRSVLRLHLEMRADNPALRIYTSLGFSGVGMRPNYYRRSNGNLADAVTLVKNL